MSAAIKEGFICADCHAQFTNVNSLLTHYQSQHSTEELNSIKGLIEKAKNKLTISSNSNSSSAEESSLLLGPPRYFDVYSDNIPEGASYSHYEAFKRIRTVQVERYSSDANRLLIRLQKLLALHRQHAAAAHGEDNGSGRRKAQEQEIVPWIDEKFVPRCPDCTASFGLLLRKHHCRLCGSIMCGPCSAYIGRELGESIVKSQMGSPSPSPSPNPAEPTPADYKLRTCSFCFRSVTKKQALASAGRQIITQFYDKLKATQRDCELKNGEYCRTIASLLDGERLYSVEQATLLRNDIIKHTERIDGLSRKIVVLGTESSEAEFGISESEKRLRSRIRSNTVHWIRDFLSGLRMVPEKGAATTTTDKKPIVVQLLDGWTSSAPERTLIDDGTDVMELQIRNMRKWIDEARTAGKTDEVEILESNLAELNQIHYQQSL